MYVYTRYVIGLSTSLSDLFVMTTTCWYHASSIYQQGMEYLIENDIVQNQPKSIANFLYHTMGLNKTAIGDYLGEK